MFEIEIIECPHCGQEALAGSQRLRLDERLGCIHCSQAFDLGVAMVRTTTIHGEVGTVAWGGLTRERRRQGLPRGSARQALMRAVETLDSR